MGKIDSITKQYMNDNSRFADAFNYFIFHGQSVIQKEKLVEQDTTELLAALDKNGNPFVKQEFRDVLKQCVVKYDANAYYVLLGIENQSDIHYAMPVKNALYDVLNYADQVSVKAKEHRNSKDLRGAEFVSGFSKQDKLIPVITLTILWNANSWDGPRSLHEMFEISDKRFLRFVPDYNLNLIIPDEITDFNQFQTELGCVLEFLSKNRDTQSTKELLREKKDRFSHLDLESAQLLNICTNIGLKIPESTSNVKGGFDMCKAFEDYKEEGRAEGREEGRAEGRIEGREEGRIEIAQTMSLNIYQTMPEISISKIAELAETTVENVTNWILNAGLPLR